MIGSEGARRPIKTRQLWIPALATAFIMVCVLSCDNPSSPDDDTGTVIVDSEPDSLNAPWMLGGPRDESGNGDQSMTEMPVGQYTLTWGTVSGYVTPGPDTQTLEPDGTITFGATYEETPEETGTIVIDCEPDELDSPWILVGPHGESGSGDGILPDMPLGQYTLTWSDVSGYITPDQETQELGLEETITFTGGYAPDGSGPEPPPMISVPWGMFRMGDSNLDPDESCATEHWVTLENDFYLCQHEVTNQEYVEAVRWALDHGWVTATSSSVKDALDGSTVELLDLDGIHCRISFSGGVFSYSDPNHPVTEVTWYGAARYCDWLSLISGLDRAYDAQGNDWLCNNHNPYGAEGYRLPTDAEWEYAAQYPDDRTYPWGNGPPDCTLANYSDCVGGTSPVGSCSPGGDSHLGFWDLAGNVYEWTNDWASCYLGTDAVTDPVGIMYGISRVLRGGAWPAPDFMIQCAFRNYALNPDASGSLYGFRAARTVDP